MSQKVNKSVKIDIKEGLKEIYPEVFEDNKINFEKLKALLSGEVIEKEDDRFYFNWAGKSNLYKLIQAPAYGTLKPDKERSVDFDNTENIVIAGENLETLKLLLKPYFGKVKMIYIDPPYNTGKDFIYRDNFKEPLKDYLEKTGQIDIEGKKLTTNTEASGRYHSDWLNFIYPRLFLARSLLRDDGVIFISIDDNEVHNLRKIMDEIFGEENFVASIIWIKKNSPQNDAKWLSDNHDFILLYSKSKQIWRPDLLPREAKHNERYSNPDNDPRGNWAASDLSVKTYNSEYVYPIANPITKEEEYPPRGRCWMTSKENMIEFIEDNRVWWGSDGKRKPVLKRFLSEVRDGIVPITIWPNNEVGSNTVGRKELKEIFKEIEGNIYDNPKPTGLIKKMLKITTRTGKNSLVLDFFSGSGTTGQAVWDLNKEDGGNRKFILVQLDEEVLDEEIKKQFPTVADICIERLRRVSEKYRKANEEQLINNNQDFGFKVLRLAQSNFNLKDEFEIQEGQNTEELKKKYLEWLRMFVDQPLVFGWTEIDIIYEVMLKEGLNLNSQIERVKIKENNFYYIIDTEQNLDFYISLEDKIETDTVEEIRTSKYKGKMFVFLDKALTDSDKINLSVFVRLKVI
ncbi:MAG: hypothetical protein STSR0008_22400 [Ignavibacterium sp.]